MNDKRLNLKVIHITESNGWSGGAAQTLFLGKELKNYGIENIYLCPENGDLGRKAKQQGFKLYNFKPKSNLDIKESIKVSKIYDEIKPHIVHAHHPKGHNMSFIAKLLSKYKPVLVVSRRVSHPLPQNILAQIKYKSKQINAYIAVCEYVKKILVEYGIEKERIHVIYSGVDKNKYFKKEKDLNFKSSLGLNNNDFVISLIGNFSKDKGQEILLKALEILNKEGYEFKVIFAGKFTDTEDFRNMVSNYINPENALCLGLRDDVDKLLNITDISINAAIKGEALSGSIRESLACGIPVIASNIAGNSEIVKDKHNGFLFQPGNYSELAEKIKILINNEHLRKTFSENAIKTITEKFTVQKMAENTLNLYLKLLK